MHPRTLLLVALAVLSLLSGAVRQYFFPGADLAPSDVPFALLGTVFVFLWYRVDSDVHNYRRSLLLNVGVIAITAFALPYYFFRSRGPKGGFIALGWFIVALAASVALDGVGGNFAYHVLQS